jgi:hypothetical protein
MQNTWLFEEDVAARLRAELYDVLTVFNVTWQSGRENVIAFTGQLLRPAESASPATGIPRLSASKATMT